MKAITILQPWAQLLIIGAKKFETRVWKLAYRGPIVIHAGRKFMNDTKAMSCLEPFFSVLAKAGFKPPELPLGAIVGTALVTDCFPTEQLEYNGQISEAERSFGDFRPGRWAWKIEHPLIANPPIKHNGMRGLFDIPDSLISQDLIQITPPIPAYIPPSIPMEGEEKCQIPKAV